FGLNLQSTNLKNRSFIFIAHRLSVAKKVDSILVMNNGTIVEDGTPKELLQKKGFYWKFMNT
ncbi:hypothetical protein, partial [Companilactobacillus crustorum]